MPDSSCKVAIQGELFESYGLEEIECLLADPPLQGCGSNRGAVKRRRDNRRYA